MHHIPYEPRAYIPRPWSPLTRAEFDELARFLPNLRDNERRRGRRPDNPRRTLDAIFWMACATGPWRTLPPELGKPDSAHRMLRRWAKSGHLDRLIMALSAHPLGGGTKLLRSMGYWICRAWRRMARVVPITAVALVQRVQLVTAWPAPVIRLPNPRHEPWRHMARGFAQVGVSAGQALRRLVGGGMPAGLVPVPGLVAAGRAALRAARRLLASANGNRREWRTR